MNILFLTIVKVNNISERGIYTDLIRTFRDNGHHVCVVCPTERRYNEDTKLTITDDVKVLTVKTLNIQKTNLVEKGIGTLMVENQFLFAIKKYFSHIKFDLVLYSTPPITFTKVIKFIKKRDNAASYLLLKDIFPQNAVDLGLIKKNGVIHRYFKLKEKKMYAVSDHIGCMSPANVEFIIQQNKEINPAKIEINPNSIQPIQFNISDVEKKRVKNNYEIPHDALTFIYGGNLGKPQGLDFLIEILAANVTNTQYFFVIIGQGTEYPKLKKWVLDNKPGNVLLLESLPKNDYDEFLSSCDVGLIFLDRRFTIPNFPSRLLSYLENKMPIIAATDNNTDLGKIMTENNFGIWCLSGNLDNFNDALLYLHTNHEARKNMGLNGYNFLLKNYLVKYSYQTIIKHF